MALNGADFNGNARYMYVPAPVVTALVPSSGMLKGGTTVRVVGSNLDAVTSSDKVMCKFGPVSVPAQVESSSSLLCETPGELFSSVRTVSSRCATTLSSSKPHHLTTSYLHHLTASPPHYHLVTPEDLGLNASVAMAMEVSTNSGGHYSDHGVSFLYQDVPDIFSVSPPQGVELGGYEVTVIGSGFLATPNLACRFGSTIVHATMISKSMVTCTAPPHMPIAVCVDVTLNGIEWSDCAAKFAYSAAVSLHSLYPSSGPVGGGTEVTITGTNFESLLVPDALAYCSFGDMRSKVYVRSSTEATCTASPLAAAGEVYVQLFVGRALASGSGSSLAYRYTNPALLFGLYPAHGRLEGGTVIVITGAGFNESQPTLCLFDPAEADGALLESKDHTKATPTSSAATVVSDSEVLCTAPSFVGSGSGLESTNGGGFVVVDIATSTTGHRAASQGLVFWYRPIPTLDSLSPFVGRVGGGTVVVVTGSGWLSGDADVVCKFGTDENEYTPIAGIAPSHRTPPSYHCTSPSRRTTYPTSLHCAQNSRTYLASPRLASHHLASASDRREPDESSLRHTRGQGPG